jgi:hypothetical protein
MRIHSRGSMTTALKLIDLTRDAVVVVADVDVAIICTAHPRVRMDMPNWAFPSCRRAGAKGIGGALLARASRDFQ